MLYEMPANKHGAHTDNLVYMVAVPEIFEQTPLLLRLDP